MPEAAPNPAFPTNKYPRLTSWWVIALVLSIAVLLLSPQQLPTSVYKLNLIALAAVAGYWIDRSIFPYARPNIDALRLLEPPPEIEVTHDEAARGMVETEHGEIPIGELQEALSGWPNYGELYYFAATQIRRALIVSATILAVSLGA
jgi:hypothetical protein